MHNIKPFNIMIISSLALTVLGLSSQAQSSLWSNQELQRIRSLWLGSLKEAPRDTSNKYANSASAAALGKALFNEKALSANGEVSCSTCHDPSKRFTDQLELSEGIGLTTRHAPSLVGAAYNTYFFWDGRADSLWAQALGPLEHPAEHGIARTDAVRVVQRLYRESYKNAFGDNLNFEDLTRFPPSASPLGDEAAQQKWRGMTKEDQDLVNRSFSHIGKAIAAFERSIPLEPTRFDMYAEAVLTNQPTRNLVNDNEMAGLKLFIGKANCVSCHNGALLTDHNFHNTGIPNPSNDQGRFAGLAFLKNDEFNCRSVYSDAEPDQCLPLSNAEVDYLELSALPISENKAIGAFKTPSLRHTPETLPFMHAGQFKSFKRVLDHYNNPPKSQVGTSELKPLGLTRLELFDLEQFLGTLSAPSSTP